MIIREVLENGLVKTYSNAGYYIHGGNPEGDYIEAIDPAEFNREYVETNRIIEPEDVPVIEAEEGGGA